MKILFIENCNECRFWGIGMVCNHPDAKEKYPLGPDRDGFGLPGVCSLPIADQQVHDYVWQGKNMREFCKDCGGEVYVCSVHNCRFPR